jgi:mRNA interferase MazF
VVVRQGEVFWVDLGRFRGSEPGGRRPAVVAQSDRFNRSQIATTVIAAITSNERLGHAPGNVRLGAGEAGLPKASVINVSQLRTIDKAALTHRAGQLSLARIDELRRGLAMLFETA